MENQTLLYMNLFVENILRYFEKLNLLLDFTESQSKCLMKVVWIIWRCYIDIVKIKYLRYYIFL